MALKILTVCPHPPLFGISAGAVRMSALLQGLAARGHELRLIALLPPNEEAAAREGLTRAWGRTLSRLDLFTGRQSRGVRDPFYLLPENYRRPEIERALGLGLEWCDVVHLEYAQTAHLIPKGCPKPVVVTNHEVQSSTYLDYFAKAPLLSFSKPLEGYRALRSLYLESVILERADRVVCLTPRDRDTLRRLLPKSALSVIPMGVDCSAFLPKPPKAKGANLLYVGYFKHRPNELAARFLLHEVMPRIWQKRPEATLTLAGSYPSQALLNARSSRILVSGQVPDLGPYYQAADVFLAPITSGRGMRGKLLESLASGLPVVGTPLALEGLDAQDGVEALLAQRGIEFAQAALRLLEHPDLYSRLSLAGRELALRYDWSRVVADYEALFGALLAGEPA